MWTKLDDQLIDHSKIFAAGDLLGRNGPAIAIGFYAIGLLWSNKHLTDGHLPLTVVRSFRHVSHPDAVADALVRAGLWEKNGAGFVIHDYDDLNPTATVVAARRRKARLRKRKQRQGKRQ